MQAQKQKYCLTKTPEGLPIFREKEQTQQNGLNQQSQSPNKKFNNCIQQEQVGTGSKQSLQTFKIEDQFSQTRGVEHFNQLINHLQKAHYRHKKRSSLGAMGQQKRQQSQLYKSDSLQVQSEQKQNKYQNQSMVQPDGQAQFNMSKSINNQFILGGRNNFINGKQELESTLKKSQTPDKYTSLQSVFKSQFKNKHSSLLNQSRFNQSIEDNSVINFQRSSMKDFNIEQEKKINYFKKSFYVVSQSQGKSLSKIQMNTGPSFKNERNSNLTQFKNKQFDTSINFNDNNKITYSTKSLLNNNRQLQQDKLQMTTTKDGISVYSLIGNSNPNNNDNTTNNLDQSLEKINNTKNSSVFKSNNSKHKSRHIIRTSYGMRQKSIPLQIGQDHLFMELMKPDQDEEEALIIPILPTIDFSQSQNHSFIEIIREIKKEFTVQNCKDLEAKFAGNYSQDVPKGIGKIIDNQGNIYKGNFMNGMKKGQGIQVYLEYTNKYNVYKGDWNDNKPNGKGVLYDYQSGMLIDGVFKNGFPEMVSTQFRIRYPEGDVYEGFMLNFKRNGKGKYYYKNGDFYEGDWSSNKRQGKGKLYLKAEGINLEGKFFNDEIIFGKVLDKNGDLYETLIDQENEALNGKFIKGKLFGKVKVDYQNGNEFIGMFSDGKKNGIGKMIYKNLKTITQDEEITSGNNVRSQDTFQQYGLSLQTDVGEYEGMFKHDVRQGMGKMKWLDGSVFEGSWYKDQRLKGKLTFVNGVIYEGQFIKDKVNGRGRIYMKATMNEIRDDGQNLLSQQSDLIPMKMFDGIFEMGVIPSEGKLTFNFSKEVYYGSHDNFVRSGFGYLFSYDGSKYEGQFEEGMKNGVGTQLYPNGDFYHGQWVNNMKEGVGKMFYKSDQNKIYEGCWQKDEKNGEGYLINHNNNEIIKSVWRQGKIEGKTTIQKISDISAINLLSERGIKFPPSIESLFRIPYHLKKIEDAQFY